MGQTISQAEASRLTDDFLTSHGFDLVYDVRAGEFPGDFYLVPFTPDGFTIRTSFFAPTGFSFSFDANGILAVYAKLLDYQPAGRYEIISPQTALQRLVDNNTIFGVYVFTNLGNPPTKTWQRSYPENETVTLWGPVDAVQSVNGNRTLVSFDGYQASGNLTGLTHLALPAFIEATGQIEDVNGVKTFNIESWHIQDHANWEVGDIRQEGDQIIFTTSQQARLILPDAPAGLPLPFENAFLRGVIHGDVYEWKYIDNHLQANAGNGGGGFVSDFHKLLLSGTPVPWNTPVPNQGNTAEGQTNYAGQTGIIEEAELAYYLRNPRAVAPEWATTEPMYIQPVWRFYGHFSGGDEFEILVQALQDEFLSPELESLEP
jgi:hypothetical protein